MGANSQTRQRGPALHQTLVSSHDPLHTHVLSETEHCVDKEKSFRRRSFERHVFTLEIAYQRSSFAATRCAIMSVKEEINTVHNFETTGWTIY